MSLSVADAASIKKNNKDILFATFTKLELSHQELQDVDFGKVEINLETNTLQLVFFEDQDWVCPEGRMCAAVMPMPLVHVIEVPIVHVSTGFCGGTIYYAELDKTPVDGNRQIVIVTDNTSMVCKIKYEAPTVVEYETFNPWTQDVVVSKMHGEALRFGHF